MRSVGDLVRSLRRPPAKPTPRPRATGTAVGSTPIAEQLPPVPPCPEGWTTGPPDFVILGAQKSGTTWWFRLIETHPRVVQPAKQRPELHVFDRLYDRWPTPDEIEAYHRYFPRPAGSLAGEKTPEYLDSPWVVPMLAAAAPDTRVLVLVRDPIARYLSGRFHADRALQRSGIEPASRGLMDRRRVVAEAIDKGRYATQLEWVAARFPAERTLVLQYERCVREPLDQLARTFAFLGLEPHAPTDAEIAQPRNASKGEPVTISPEHHAVLRDVYRPEVRRLLERVPDLDLSLWPDFADLA